MYFLILLLLVILRILIPSTTINPLYSQIELVVDFFLVIFSWLGVFIFVKSKTAKIVCFYSISLIFMVAVSNVISKGIYIEFVIEAILESSKYVVPIFISLIFSETDYFKKGEYFLTPFYLVIILFLLVFFFGEKQSHAGIERLPLYFGTLHDNGYMIAICVVYLLLYYDKIKIRFLCPLLLIGLYFLYGYHVRTAQLLVVIAVCSIFYYKFDVVIRRGVFSIILFFSFISFLVIMIIDDGIYNNIMLLSSGRLDMWATQFERFTTASWVQLFFGYGVKGDVISSDIWAWRAKNAHSTLLSFFVQYGVIGFCLFILLIISVYRYFTVIGFVKKNFWIFTSFIMTLIISNGLVERYVPFVFFMLLMCYVRNEFLDNKQNHQIRKIYVD